MEKIKILDKKTAELIAAGEVVENPASVIKELIENAADAGATQITVEIKNGGKSYMRITDNGCGMSAIDAKNAFIRHATSKIEKAEDLFNIKTMGFRGEALASVCSVSKTELFTKETGATDGTYVFIEGGEYKTDEICGTPDGTTVIVRDLFYNTPARLNFLKKDSTEGAYVTTVVERAALSMPDVSVRFIKDGKEQLFTSGDGILKNTVYSVFGKDFANGLTPVSYKENSLELTGFISKPLCSKANRNMQVLYVNHRNIRSKIITVALEESYKNSIMTGKFPACVMNLQLDPAKIDVNVHPRKTEIKFSEEGIIYGFIYKAVKEALKEESGKQDFIIDTPRTANFSRPVEKPDYIPLPIIKKEIANENKETKPAIDFFTFNEEKDGTESKSILNNETVIISDNKLAIPWNIISTDNKVGEKEENSVDKLINEYQQSIEEKAEKIAEKTIKPDEQTVIHEETNTFQNSYRIVGELFSTYLVAENDTDAIIIDKHAAHERILFEDLKKNVKSFNRQQLLEPIAITLSKIDCDILMTNSEKLSELGFSVEEFGTGTILVREVPEILEYSDAESVLCEIAAVLRRGGQDFELKALDEILHMIACKSAVKAGSFTSDYEKNEFLKKLLSINNIKYCPHGRPVMVELTKTKLEKMFRRIV